jgi:hypothetical protein
VFGTSLANVRFEVLVAELLKIQLSGMFAAVLGKLFPAF